MPKSRSGMSSLGVMLFLLLVTVIEVIVVFIATPQNGDKTLGIIILITFIFVDAVMLLLMRPFAKAAAPEGPDAEAPNSEGSDDEVKRLEQEMSRYKNRF